MGDRIDDAFAAWREATDPARSPRGLASAVARAIEMPTLAESLWSFALPALVSGALIAGGLVVLAAGSARSLAHEAADYAIAGSP